MVCMFLPITECLANKHLDNKVYTIKKFTWSPVQGGAHSKNTIFKYKNRAANTEEDISVYDYFKKVYNITLQFWDLPLIEMQRGYMPMELATLVPNQRYNFKLSPDQTAAMIKFAVTRPKERIASIQHGIGMLKWNEDRYLNFFGLKIEPTMTMVSLTCLILLLYF